MGYVNSVDIPARPVLTVVGYRRMLAPAALTLAVIVDVWLLTIMPRWVPGFDAYAAWSVDLSDPWQGAEASMVGLGVFRWSPVAAQVSSLFAVLPWPVFLAGVLAAQLAVIVAMAGRRWPYVVLFPPVLFNLYMGNVDLFMGAAIVAGFRWSGAWAFLFLTKLTPGVGVLWFAFRREWRAFAIALGTTAAIVAVSFALAPHLWFMWADALREMSSLPQSVLYPPLMVRLPLAVAITWYAARTDRRWLLPVACLVAVPNPWFVAWAVLGASVALTRGAAPAGRWSWPSARRRAGGPAPQP
jgi:hypothetical protein